jgi:nucleoid DNA-binding protein
VVVNKAALTRRLTKSSGISLREAAVCLDIILDEIAAAIIRGERIELRELGSFTVRKTAERKTALNNPAAAIIPEHGRVVFRPCRKLRKSVWDQGGS